MGKKNFFNSSLLDNNRTYLQYVERLTEIALSSFKWSGLPDTVDSRFLEYALFYYGSCLYFNDDVIGNLALPAMLQGMFDVYGEAMLRRAYSPYNNYQNLLKKSNSVIIWNNMVRTNSILDIKMFSLRLYNLDRIVDINANTQKSPYMIECDEKQRLTMENLFKEIDGNVPVIFGKKGFATDNIKALKLDTSYVADKIYELKTNIWNEALTYLGVANMAQQKKERMVTDEVIRSQAGAFACRRSRLNMRTLAAEKINKMFGTNISVEFDESVEKEYSYKFLGNVSRETSDNKEGGEIEE